RPPANSPDLVWGKPEGFEEILVGSWSHSLELHMPAEHRSIVQAGTAEDGHPAILVDRAGPPELLWVCQEADNNSLLFTQPSDLSVELIKPCFENLGGATIRAVEKLANLSHRKARGDRIH